MTTPISSTALALIATAILTAACATAPGHELTSRSTNSAAAQHGPDAVAIEKVVRDLFDGWFDGDVARVRAAYHPGLAKRTLRQREGGEELETITTAEMIDAAESGLGKESDVPDRQIRIEISEVHDGMATVVVRSAVFREYLHLVRTRDGWKIVNSLWRRSLPAAQPADLRAKDDVTRTVLDYFEGWFEADAARIGRAMHQELAKRRFAVTDAGVEELRESTYQPMVDAAGRGVGKAVDVPNRNIRINVVEVYEPMATVIVHSAVYHEYLHLVRTRDGWKIVNALWQKTS